MTSAPLPTPPPVLSLPERASSALRELDLASHLATPEIKQRYVTTMFDIIAPSYDRFTRCFSFGMDQTWKRELLIAVAQQDQRRGLCVVDLACGTGDLARGVAARLPQARIEGLDASPAMIVEAQAIMAQIRSQRAAAPEGAGQVRLADADLTFRVGDMMQLPYADQSVDILTVGYGLRNVPDHRACLRELYRVLRPGGRLYCLDFCLPPLGWWRHLYLGYLSVAGACVGLLWHGHADVYGYISRSIAAFVTADQLAEDMRGAGLVIERMAPKLNGGMCLHIARRPLP